MLLHTAPQCFQDCKVDLVSVTLAGVLRLVNSEVICVGHTTSSVPNASCEATAKNYVDLRGTVWKMETA